MKQLDTQFHSDAVYGKRLDIMNEIIDDLVFDFANTRLELNYFKSENKTNKQFYEKDKKVLEELLTYCFDFLDKVHKHGVDGDPMDLARIAKIHYNYLLSLDINSLRDYRKTHV